MTKTIFEREFVLNLFGVLYRVHEVDPENIEGLRGQIKFEETDIRIRSNINLMEKQRTLLHEIFHAILEDSGIRDILDKNDISNEWIVKVITNALFSILMANKDILREIYFE